MKRKLLPLAAALLAISPMALAEGKACDLTSPDELQATIGVKPGDLKEDLSVPDWPRTTMHARLTTANTHSSRNDVTELRFRTTLSSGSLDVSTDR